MKKPSMAVFLVIIAISLLSSKAQAVTITSVGNGNWNATGAWNPAQVPTASDSVVIQNGQMNMVGCTEPMCILGRSNLF